MVRFHGSRHVACCAEKYPKAVSKLRGTDLQCLTGTEEKRTTLPVSLRDLGNRHPRYSTVVNAI